MKSIETTKDLDRLCPTCQGTGTIQQWVKSTSQRPGYLTPVPCTRCLGTGELGEEQARMVAQGKERRADRSGRKFTLKMEADRLGVMVIHLAEMENGLRPFPSVCTDGVLDVRATQQAAEETHV